MARYRPQYAFDTPLLLLYPIYITNNGVRKKTFTSADNGILIYGSFKTYGGTEREINGLYTVEDTANIETWYRPDIKSGCGIALANSKTVIYEIVGEPENIDQRNQFLKFRVLRIKGGA